jgi:hypothetical protein
MRPTFAWLVSFLVALLLVWGVPSVAVAQESKSAALAQELTALLDRGKIDAIAAKDPSAPDLYVAALYFQGSQLLVVSARYSVPVILNEKLAKKDYREIYTDLNSASIPNTRVLVMDMGADGLKLKREESHFDTCDIGNKSYVFDGDWKKQNLASEDEYNKAFADADARYVKMLAALVAQAKK